MPAQPVPTAPAEDPARAWLPDFCTAPALFPVLLLAQLVALIGVLVPTESAVPAWQRLGPASLFSIWIALVSAASLCLLKRPLRALGPGWGGVSAALLVGGCAWICCTLALLFGEVLQLPRVGNFGFHLRVSGLAVLVAGAALRYGYMHEQWKQQVQAKARAELEALQARIRPHFLFNTLNAIASLVRSAPAAAEAAVLDLSDLLRAALRAGADLVPACDEFELAERYLAIEKLRLGERLQQRIDASALPAALKLPPLSLQPLVENAVQHGVQLRPEGGLVELWAEAAGGSVRIHVRNPLGSLPDVAGHGLAQHNVRLRLQAAFGPAADLRCAVQDGHYLCTLSLPAA